MSANKITLAQIAMAAVAARLQPDPSVGLEATFLAEQLKALPLGAGSLADVLEKTLAKPDDSDRALVELARSWDFSAAEILSIALASAVDEDVMTGRAVAFAQAPLAGSRPTLGLLAEVFSGLVPGRLSPAFLAQGNAFQSGVLTLLNDAAPYPERAVAVPIAVSLALAGQDASWPGGVIGVGRNASALPASTRAMCRRHAEALRADKSPVLVLRSASLDEARSAAEEVGEALAARPFFAENVAQPGLAAWLRLRKLIPVFLLDLGPGETKSVPVISFYHGPVMVVAGMDGTIDAPGTEVVNWSLPLPSVEERVSLWREALPGDAQSAELAHGHRQSAGRIQQLGRLAQHRARLEGQSKADVELVRRVARSGEGCGLESLAQPLPEPVPEDALVLSAELRSELDSLLARCRQRDGLATGLGAAAETRYTPGVKALFSGPSGTGKTLAACWLATRLGLPLFRVDLASITSKYIGETEKNLARLLARAERTEVVLLFDDADSLFGKRTDVRDSNDRFANAQTNYLLQRIETFDGVAILTSNSRGRFDGAFSRRLDAVIEFPVPAPTERRALWQAHLGADHQLSMQELNLLAGQCDFAGGQIRNVVLSAAVDAREENATLDLPKIARALAAEYKKAGRTVPPSLVVGRTAMVNAPARA